MKRAAVLFAAGFAAGYFAHLSWGPMWLTMACVLGAIFFSAIGALCIVGRWWEPTPCPPRAEPMP